MKNQIEKLLSYWEKKVCECGCDRWEVWECKDMTVVYCKRCKEGKYLKEKIWREKGR